MRMDGAYGWAYGPHIIKVNNAVGYLMRCADYRLLDADEVKRIIKEQTPMVFDQPTTGTKREVFDVPQIVWIAGEDKTVRVTTRLIVTRRKLHGNKAKVGKTRGDWAYELFVTDRSREAFTACDIVSLYFGRGAFEQMLAHEDRECAPQRWLSNHPEGQSLWQLVCQHIWNVRLRLGHLLEGQETPRRTLWVPSLSMQPAQSPVGKAMPFEEPEPEIQSADEEAQTALCCSDPALSEQEEEQREEADEDETMRCLAGLELPADRPNTPTTTRRFYRAYSEICDSCTLFPKCFRTSYETKTGGLAGLIFGSRDVSRQAEEGPSLDAGGYGIPDRTQRDKANGETSLAAVPLALCAKVGEEGVVWEDWPALGLRTSWTGALEQLQVNVVCVELPRSAPAVPLTLLTRAQRAHRRLSYAERLARNRHSPRRGRWRIVLHGLPGALVDLLSISTCYEKAG
jgi:hypothetical protein